MTPPPVIAVRRMQKFGERYILAEDLHGCHWVVDRDSQAPIREVIYFEFYYPEWTH